MLAETAVAAAAAGRWTDAETRLAAAEEVNQHYSDQLCLPYITSTRAAIKCRHGDYSSALASGAPRSPRRRASGWSEPWARADLGTTLLELRDYRQRSRGSTPPWRPDARGPTVRRLAPLASAHWRRGPGRR